MKDVMFQSNGSLFGNSSSVSIHLLKKILRIPQDQLNKLNNIPGWISCEKTISETSVALPNRINYNNSSEKETFEKQNSPKTNLNTSNSSKSVKIGNKNNFIPDQELPLFNSKKPTLSKSLSLNSLKVESSKVNRKLKRSSSFSDMEEKCLGYKFELNTLVPQQKNEQCKYFIEKSHFMDSGVQCKMSQCSQSMFEMPLSERIEHLTTNDEKVNSEIPENEWKSMSTSVCEELKLHDSPIASISKTVTKTSENKMDFNKKEKVSLVVEKESSIEIINKNITNEESFVSQALPCAQPCSADNIQNDVVLTSGQNYASSISHVQESAAVPPIKSLENNKLTTKRKRYNKLEKDSKKLKSLGNINILYSSEQIKNMIEMMKLLNE